MATFFAAVSGIFIILVMMMLGLFLAKNNWFDDKSTNLIAKLVTQVALPAYMISTIVSQFSAKKLLEIIPDLIFPVTSMLILFIISVGIVKLFKIDEKHRGLFQSMFANSNTVFVGLPVNMALFGEKSLPYVLIYYMANTTFFWTLGVYLIQKDGNDLEKFSFKKTLQKIFSPPLLGFMIGIVIVLLKIPIPDFLMQDFTYIGDLTIPLSMIFIGISISSVKLSGVKFDSSNYLILIGRFILAPIIMAMIVLPTSMPLLMKQVFVMQSAMPVMTNAPVVSRLYKADHRYASFMVTETTLLSLIIIPILMVIVSNF